MILDANDKRTINYLLNTKNIYIYIYILRNECIYSEGFIVTIISEDDS